MTIDEEILKELKEIRKQLEKDKEKCICFEIPGGGGIQSTFCPIHGEYK